MMYFFFLIQSAATQIDTGQEPPTEPIVVVGTKQEESLEEKKHIVTGSRIPRRSEAPVDSLIRSNTRLGGLTPGSGLDPYQGRADSIKVRSCTSDDPALTGQEACFIGDIQKAISEKDYVSAMLMLQRIEASGNVTAVMAYRMAQLHYQVADALDNNDERILALEELSESDLTSLAQKRAARRSIASLSIKEGDRPTAIRQLKLAIEERPDDAESIGWLAILLNENKEYEQSSEMMARAILLLEKSDSEIPVGWRELAGNRGRN